MTATAGRAHAELPRTDSVKHPATFMLTRFRPAAAGILRRRWDLELRGTGNVPVTGPVVLAGNHVGFLDGPLMAIMSPRPAHALTKKELFGGPLGAFLLGAGQIPVDRDRVDVPALKAILRVLRDGGVAGLFPESTRGSGEVERVFGGAAYLALVTGATVVPVSFLGTRVPGGASNSLPPAGDRIVITYGPPLSVESSPWPRLRPEVEALSATIREAMIANLREAEQATGLRLPGPIPEAPVDDTTISQHDQEQSKDEQ
jgi:1-acyl-sn-glycerol-3-phosphate acyltransferase